MRQWHEMLAGGRAATSNCADLAAAVLTLKCYLEDARPRAGAVREFEIPPRLLSTRDAIRQLMPFVLSTETIEASRRRLAARCANG